MTITLGDVLAAAGARRIALAPETSGYLALAIADATSRLPLHVEDAGVLLTAEGTIVIPRRGEVVAPAEAARALRDRLARLLRVSSGSPMPGLTSAARPRKENDVDGVVAAIEAALIPVNRAAGRRALGRLARETEQLLASGASLPRPTAPAPSAVEPASSEPTTTIAPREPEPAKVAPPAPVVPLESAPAPSAPEPTAIEATGTPAWVVEIEPTPAPRADAASDAAPAADSAEAEDDASDTDIAATHVTVVDAQVTVVDAPVGPIEAAMAPIEAPIDEPIALAEAPSAEVPITCADGAIEVAITCTDTPMGPPVVLDDAPVARVEAPVPADGAASDTCAPSVEEAVASDPPRVEEVKASAPVSSLPPPPSARVDTTPTLMGVGAVGVQAATALLAELEAAAAEAAPEADAVDAAAVANEEERASADPPAEAVCEESAGPEAIEAMPTVSIENAEPEPAIEASGASDDEPAIEVAPSVADDVLDGAHADEPEAAVSGFPPGVDPHEVPTIVPGGVEPLPEPASLDVLDEIAARLRAHRPASAPSIEVAPGDAAPREVRPARRSVAELAPAKASDVDELIERFGVSQARDPSRVARSLKSFAGLELTAAPPVVWESPRPARADAAPEASAPWEPEPMTPTPPPVRRARRKGLAVSAALLAIGIVATGALWRYGASVLPWSDAPAANAPPAGGAPAGPVTGSR